MEAIWTDMILPFYIITLNIIEGGRSHFTIVTAQAGDIFLSLYVNTPKNKHSFSPLLYPC